MRTMQLLKANKNKLTKDELLQFNSFLLQLNKLCYQRKVSLLFRGEKLINLSEKLNIISNQNNPNYTELLDRLFMVGEKGRYFYTEQTINGTEKQIGLDDIDNDTFANIFNQLKYVAGDVKLHSLRFYEKNKNFMKYFLDLNNRVLFLSAINGCSTIEKNFFKRYYLTLLHQLDAKNYKRTSHLVSTSTQYSIANEFSGTNSKDKSVIIHGWTPKPMFANLYRQLRLPIYIGVPYPQEEEVTLLGGILPHYIIGVEIKDAATFFINSAIFQNNASSDVFKEGFNLDQSTFMDVLKKTNYKRGYAVSNDNVSEI